jgi:hypothetical protein
MPFGCLVFGGRGVKGVNTGNVMFGPFSVCATHYPSANH